MKFYLHHQPYSVDLQDAPEWRNSERSGKKCGENAKIPLFQFPPEFYVCALEFPIATKSRQTASAVYYVRSTVLIAGLFDILFEDYKIIQNYYSALDFPLAQ